MNLLGRWLASGRTEPEFWHQTPASFVAAMRADRQAAQLALEERVLLAYLAAQMGPVAKVGKLGPLERWLEQVRPRKKRSVGDMVVALQDAAARGAPITITKVKG